LIQSKSLSNNFGQIVNGPLLLTPSIKKDERGAFFVSWNKKEFDSLIGKNINFVQDAHSLTKRGVIRGMHYQVKPNQQSKLIRCIRGEIYSVLIDIRKHSSTFSSWAAVKISSKNFCQLWVPAGFANGFLTITDYAEVLYKMTGFWSKESERSIRWNDPTILINWLDLNNLPVLSKKDLSSPLFKELSELDFF
tara:strand:- start:1142 stop:1720 length:579 start_codon:yes stop_codon:yes gene_type:complete